MMDKMKRVIHANDIVPPKIGPRKVGYHNGHWVYGCNCPNPDFPPEMSCVHVERLVAGHIKTVVICRDCSRWCVYGE